MFLCLGAVYRTPEEFILKDELLPESERMTALSSKDGGVQMDLKIGDIVGRKSYGCDVVFKVHDILRQGNSFIIVLKGVNLRILADAPENDIIKLPQSKINEADSYFLKRLDKVNTKTRKFCVRAEEKLGRAFYRSEEKIFKRPGRILHLDGDSAYLEMCMKSYKEYHIEAIGRAVPEADQPKRVAELLEQYNPDILVLTGHDAILKHTPDGSRNTNSVANYRNSKYFIDAVKEARKHEQSLDDLVIFAGACQSYFEGIMAAGANFASSPDRILIHALDPVIICKVIAFTPIDQVAPLEQLLSNTITGIKGIGGIQTRGKYRDGMPNTHNSRL